MNINSVWRRATGACCFLAIYALLLGHATAQFRPGEVSDLTSDRDWTPQHPIALQGYCPVTLQLEQKWIAGDPELNLIFDHREYWFSGARQLEIFASAPQSYAPVLGGDCVVAFADGGGRTPGLLQYALMHGGRVFLFESEVAMQRFADAPEAYADADIANGGLCPVASVDDRKAVAGNPAAAALYNGQRFLFANAHSRAQFFQQPRRYVRVEDTSIDQDHAKALRQQRLTQLRTARQTAEKALPARSATGPSGQTKMQHGAESREPVKERIELSGAPLMSGYCPVSCRDQANWVRGRYEHRTEYHGYTILFGGKAELQAFLASPLKYLPALGGDCVTTFVETNKRVRGSVYHAAFYPVDEETGLTDESRLFLFTSDEQKSKFYESVDKFVDADVAEAGVCVVTRQEKRKIAAGDPNNVVWYAGLRYYFAGKAEQEKFLADPFRYIAH